MPRRPLTRFPSGSLTILLIVAIAVSAVVHFAVIGLPFLMGGGERTLSPFDVQFSALRDVVDTQRDRYDELLREAEAFVKTKERERGGTFTWTRETFPDNLRLLGQSMGLAIRDVKLTASKRGPRLAVHVNITSSPDKAVGDLLMTLFLVGRGTSQLSGQTEEAIVTVAEKNGPGTHEVVIGTRFCRDLAAGKLGLLDLVAQAQVSS
jgi:hypothetical protein